MEGLTGVLTPRKVEVSDKSILDELALVVSSEHEITFSVGLVPDNEEYLKTINDFSKLCDREQMLTQFPELQAEGVEELSDEKFRYLLGQVIGQTYGVNAFHQLEFSFYHGSPRQNINQTVQNYNNGIVSVCNLIGEGPEAFSRKYPFNSISFSQVCGQLNKERAQLAIANWKGNGYRVGQLGVFQPKSDTDLDDFNQIGEFSGNLFPRGHDGVIIEISGNPTMPFFDFSLEPPNKKDTYSENLRLVLRQISEGQIAYVSHCD